MKRANKLIALLLAMVMAFSMFTLPAYAVETEESEQAETTTEQTESEDVVDTIEKIFDIIIEILKMVHELVGSILVAVGEECPFCGTIHNFNDNSNKEESEVLIYTVTFDLNYKNAPASIVKEVTQGELVAKIDEPVRENYSFDGWYTNKNFDQIFDFSSIIDSNITLFAKWTEKNTILTLSANETSFMVETESDITFTVQTNDTVSSVDLYKSNEKIATMYDDGTNGDAISNDGIFSYSYLISSSSEIEYTYYAIADGNYVSNNVTVRFYDSLTIEDYNDFVSIFDEIKNIENQFKDANDKVNKDDINDCLLAIKDYALTLQNAGLVHYYDLYEINGQLISITIKLSSGLEIVFVPNNGEKLSSGKQLTIMSQIKSYIPSEHVSGGENLLGLSVDAMSDLGDPHIWIKDENVTLDTFSQMGANQVILWSGHGVPTKQCTYLMTQEAYDKIRFWIYDPIYFIDLAFIQNKMCITSDGFLAVNYKYLNENLPDLTGSFVYLLSCTSGDDSKLCDAFINKGAVSLVAVHNSIDSFYGLCMQAVLGFALTQINPETNNYYTVSEAMSICYEEYGTDDGDGAYPYIYGKGALKGNYRIANAETGTLSGKICKATDRFTAINNATININRDDEFFRKAHSNESGNYSEELAEGKYYVEILADGYIPFYSYASVNPNENTYMETFLLVEGDESQIGTAEGKVINSLSGSGVADVTLTIKRDWNNTFAESEVIATTKTSSGGNYSIELPLGNYTVIAEKDGFVSESFNIIVQNGATANQNGTITPIISGNDYLITLTWDENPRDLDSHMVGNLSDGNNFHVYYSHKSQMDGSVEVCNLDYDDTSSYGPEHITLKANTSSPYYYYIYRYAGSGTVASSGAKVTVHQGNTLIAEFNVPTDLGSADYWNVFAIKDGELIINNTITSSANTSYAG